MRSSMAVTAATSPGSLPHSSTGRFDLKKGASIFGARYGKGYLTCRKNGGEGWSAPATVRVEGGSFGLQLGVPETDSIMLMMNSRGADKMMASKFTVGGAAEAAAGPVGRTATAET